MNNEVFMLQNARYIRVNRKKAKKAYNDGATVIIAPVYANMYFQGCNLWTMISKIELFKRYDEVIDFDKFMNEYEWYNCQYNELGKYAKYFIYESEV